MHFRIEGNIHGIILNPSQSVRILEDLWEPFTIVRAIGNAWESVGIPQNLLESIEILQNHQQSSEIS